MDRESSVYSAPPRLFAPVGAILALAGAIVLIALGHVILGSIVLGLAVLALLFLMQELAAGSTRFVADGLPTGSRRRRRSPRSPAKKSGSLPPILPMRKK